jgi:hypothetical protein
MIPIYLYCQNETEIPGAGLVLYARPPYYLFRVLKFSITDMEIFKHRNDGVYCQVPSYRVYLSLYGQLQEGYNPAPELIIEEAVKFYLTEKIIPNAYQFKRYKDNP